MISDEEIESWRDHCDMAQTGPCELCGEHCHGTRRLGWCPDCWAKSQVLEPTPAKDQA